MTRTSALSVRVPPTRWNSRSSSTRRNLACTSGLISRDLVEEQRAARGLLDAADLGRDRAGERALLVAEQLGLEELLGQRRAVDRDERLSARAASPGGSRRETTSLPVPDSPVMSTVVSDGRHAPDLEQRLLPRPRDADDPAPPARPSSRASVSTVASSRSARSRASAATRASSASRWWREHQRDAVGEAACDLGVLRL